MQIYLQQMNLNGFKVLPESTTGTATRLLKGLNLFNIRALSSGEPSMISPSLLRLSAIHPGKNKK